MLFNIYELLLKHCVYDTYGGGSPDLGTEYNDKAENPVN